MLYKKETETKDYWMMPTVYVLPSPPNTFPPLLRELKN